MSFIATIEHILGLSETYTEVRHTLVNRAVALAEELQAVQEAYVGAETSVTQDEVWNAQSNYHSALENLTESEREEVEEELNRYRTDLIG